MMQFRDDRRRFYNIPDEEKWISDHDGDKHEFYRDYIAPYKGELELWYQSICLLLQTLCLYFLRPGCLLS
jgi:hypothetical protein